MAIVNEADSTTEVAEANRAQIEHRAVWMGLIYDEMRKADIDAEPIIRRAISRNGVLDGENFKKAAGKTGDCKAFEKVFVNDLGVNTFRWKNIYADEENLKVEFHYCPLVAAWRKLGFDEKTCALLCDMAMDGDRNIAAQMGLKLDLEDTIARGGPCCKMHFYR
jgi:hypothetical protein